MGSVRSTSSKVFQFVTARCSFPSCCSVKPDRNTRCGLNRLCSRNDFRSNRNTETALQGFPKAWLAERRATCSLTFRRHKPRLIPVLEPDTKRPAVLIIKDALCKPVVLQEEGELTASLSQRSVQGRGSSPLAHCVVSEANGPLCRLLSSVSLCDSPLSDLLQVSHKCTSLSLSPPWSLFPPNFLVLSCVAPSTGSVNPPKALFLCPDGASPPVFSHGL